MKAIKVWTKDEVIEDYKQRINKAIEYIEEMDYHEIQDKDKNKLLDILKGNDNNG